MSQVLLVDDDATQLFLRGAVLRTAGFSVLTASNAADAFSFLRDPSSDVAAVITDHVLGEDGGTDFVREIRQTWKSLPVIIVTGLPDAEPEYAGLNVGFLQKPCPPAELIQAVQASLSGGFVS